MSETESSRYGAFLSYRHVEPDRTWAKWLHGALETYRTPKRLVAQGVPARVGRVFRDEEELPASAELKADIAEALEGSRFLIVICSPRTPESRWVNEEVSRFRDMQRHDRILALLVEGEPHTSFPAALREIRNTSVDEHGTISETIEEVEPLAADVRTSRPEPPRHLKRMAKLRLLACLLGCRFDDLRWREQERRQRRLVRAGIALVALVVVLAALTVEAVRQRGRAEARGREVARLFAGHLRETGREAWLRGDLRRAYDDLTRAYAAGETGWSTRFLVARARERAEALVFETAAVGGFVPPRARAVAADASGRFAVAAVPGDKGTAVRLFSLPDGTVTWEHGTDDREVGAAVAPGGTRVALAGGRFELWDPARAEPLAVVRALSRSPRFSPDGKSIAVLGLDEVRVHDTADGRLVVTHPLARTGATRLRWIDDARVAVAHAEGGVTLLEGARSRLVEDADGFATDGAGRLVLWTKRGDVMVRGPGFPAPARFALGGEPVAAVPAAGTDRLAVRVAGRPLRLLLDLPGEVFSRHVDPALPPHSDPLAFSADGALLATAGEAGEVRVVDARTGEVLWAFDHRRRFRVAEAGFDAGGRHLWVSSWRAAYKRRRDEGRFLRLWRLPPRVAGALPEELERDVAAQLAAHDPAARADHAPAPPSVSWEPADDGRTRVTIGGRSWTVPGRVESAGASADGRLVATVVRGEGESELAVRDARTGTVFARSDDAFWGYEFYGFAAGGAVLVMRQVTMGTHARYPIAGYDVSTLEERWSFGPGAGEARVVLARDPARTRAVGNVETHRDLRVVTALVDLESGALTELAEEAAEDVAWHPSGRAVAALLEDGVRVWDAATGALLLRDPPQEEQAAIEGKRAHVEEEDPMRPPSEWVRFDASGAWLVWRRDGRTTRRLVTVETAAPAPVRRRAERLLADSPDYP